MASDYYGELGVSKTASPDEIKKAFKKLAAELHPDKNQGKPGIEDRFKRVNQAYQALRDEKKRALYDEFGDEGLREGFDANMARAYRNRRGPSGSGFGGFDSEDLGGGFGDLFGDLFGGGRRSRRPRQAPDAESEISIEFLSAVRGAELELALSGGRTVKVRIPAGADDGDKVRVKGAGTPGAPGQLAGDLILTLRVKTHPSFERDGLDLTLDVPINIAEAYFGAKIEVPTLDGSVTLKVPVGTQSGQVLRLRGKGIQRGDKVGDLFARFLIRLPRPGDASLDEAAQAMGAATDPELRANLKL
ncbi:MAG TPA: J domain-containing protein [Polyangiaceae bacterium]|nr:J domain-containing protein [Polyangiaceae bacterium]